MVTPLPDQCNYAGKLELIMCVETDRPEKILEIRGHIPEPHLRCFPLYQIHFL